jgi:Holliday junction DNA helicase RuvA
MIRYLQGILAEKDIGAVVIDLGGIGYEVHVPTNSAMFLRESGDEVKVYTYMQVREDDMSLFGFASESELTLFRQLISVNSVGAKGALAILSSAPVSEIKKAIVFEDVDMITRANGIGKKTAQKVVLELKDKMGEIAAERGDSITGTEAAAVMDDDNRSAAIDALTGLGFTRSEAAEALIGADKDLEIEEYIKIGLKNRG